jgi:hypothetical protein
MNFFATPRLCVLCVYKFSGSGSTDAGFTLRKRKAFASQVHPDGIPGGELTGQNGLRQGIFQLLLNGPLQRAGAVDRVETCFP